MEPELLQLIITFVVGLVCGALIMLLWNKLSSGSASPAGLKQEYQDYQEQVETHFEETSKKFQDMTEQYQDLYKHLSVGATSLCRPDSVAAALADESQAQVKLEKPQAPAEVVEADEAVLGEAGSDQQETKAQESELDATKAEAPSAKDEVQAEPTSQSSTDTQKSDAKK